MLRIYYLYRNDQSRAEELFGPTATAVVLSSTRSKGTHITGQSENHLWPANIRYLIK